MEERNCGPSHRRRHTRYSGQDDWTHFEADYDGKGEDVEHR